MKNTFKKLITLLTITILILFVTAGLWGCNSLTSTQQVERRLGVRLPSGTTKLYFSGGPSVIHIAILQLETEPTVLLSSEQFNFNYPSEPRPPEITDWRYHSNPTSEERIFDFFGMYATLMEEFLLTRECSFLWHFTSRGASTVIYFIEHQILFVEWYQ